MPVFVLPLSFAVFLRPRGYVSLHHGENGRYCPLFRVQSRLPTYRILALFPQSRLLFFLRCRVALTDKADLNFALSLCRRFATVSAIRSRANDKRQALIFDLDLTLFLFHNSFLLKLKKNKGLDTWTLLGHFLDTSKSLKANKNGHLDTWTLLLLFLEQQLQLYKKVPKRSVQVSKCPSPLIYWVILGHFVDTTTLYDRSISRSPIQKRAPALSCSKPHAFNC